MSGPPDTRHRRSAYDVISALQKACRRGQPEQAAAFAIELAQSGHGGWFFTRAAVMACEDCDPRATGLVADVAALADQWKASKGKDLLPVARAAVALALAPKSRLANYLVLLHGAEAAEPVEIEDHCYDMHTRRGRQLGRGREHFDEEASRLIEFQGDLVALEADVWQRALTGLEAGETSRRMDTAPPTGSRRAMAQLRMTGENQEREQ